MKEKNEEDETNRQATKKNKGSLWKIKYTLRISLRISLIICELTIVIEYCRQLCSTS